MFISFEGGEGAGKSEQIKRFKSFLETEGREVVTTREPGGAELAEKIRYLLLNPEVSEMHPMTEVLLYAAARREHLNDIILPALEEGKTVITDRFLDSSVVYQGIVKNVGWQRVYDINMEATDGLVPDVTFYFDVTPEVGLKRIKQNEGREVNRFDEEPLAFHREVQKGYRFLCKMFPRRFLTIDADKDIDEIAGAVQLSWIENV